MSIKSRSRGQLYSLSFDSEKLTVSAADGVSSKPDISLRWADVNGVVAFKRDCLSMDQICLTFLATTGGLELNEEMEGWPGLLEALPSMLPVFPRSEEWWENVVQPPFSTNLSRLFSRVVVGEEPPPH
ncbi:MAG TPA: hypothetical protein VGL89_08800 [Candidatus Koribacter sp.]|jgi:hypothetical protein